MPGRPGGVVLRGGTRRATRPRAATAWSWSSSSSGSSASASRAQVPLGDDRLVAVGVAPAVVDRAEDRGRVVGVHEGARPVVDGLAGDRHVVGVHHAVDEADEHPLRDQRRLRGDDGLEAARGRAARRRRRRGGAGRSRGRRGGAAGRGRRVARRTGSCRPAGGCSRPGPARRRAAAVSRCTVAPGRDDGQRAGGRDAEGVHRLADDVLAQHRPDRGQPVAAARERRAARALEVQVAQPPVGVGELAEQQRAAVAEPRDEAAELVPGVGLRDRGGAAGHPAPTSSAEPSRAAQPVRVEAELGGERLVEGEQPRRREPPRPATARPARAARRRSGHAGRGSTWCSLNRAYGQPPSDECLSRRGNRGHCEVRGGIGGGERFSDDRSVCSRWRADTVRPVGGSSCRTSGPTICSG